MMYRDDELLHLQDEWRSKKGPFSDMATELKQGELAIKTLALTIICPCGGPCENENGSIMIDYFSKVVWCTDCLTRYEVPVSAFTEQVISVQGIGNSLK